MKQRNFETTLFRYVPGTSPVHKLWAGTKILGLILISVVVSLFAGWVSFGVLLIFLVILFVIAKLPKSALRLFPGWFLFIVVALDLAFGLFSGSKPYLKIGSFHVGVGGVLKSAEFLVFGGEILLLFGIISWTTKAAELSTSIIRLLGIFKKRKGFIQYVNVLALAIRAIPLAISDLKVMIASRRLQGYGRESLKNAQSMKEIGLELYDFIKVAIINVITRAGEMGLAIVARGGYNASVGSEGGPKKLDFVAFTILLAVLAAISYCGFVFP